MVDVRRQPDEQRHQVDRHLRSQVLSKEAGEGNLHLPGTATPDRQTPELLAGLKAALVDHAGQPIQLGCLDLGSSAINETAVSRQRFPTPPTTNSSQAPLLSHPH